MAEYPRPPLLLLTALSTNAGSREQAPARDLVGAVSAHCQARRINSQHVFRSCTVHLSKVSKYFQVPWERDGDNQNQHHAAARLGWLAGGSWLAPAALECTPGSRTKAAPLR